MSRAFLYIAGRFFQHKYLAEKNICSERKITQAVFQKEEEMLMKIIWNGMDHV